MSGNSVYLNTTSRCYESNSGSTGSRCIGKSDYIAYRTGYSNDYIATGDAAGHSGQVSGVDRAMAGIKMGVDSYRKDKVILWDGEKEKYVRKHPRPRRTAKYPVEIS